MSISSFLQMHTVLYIYSTSVEVYSHVESFASRGVRVLLRRNCNRALVYALVLELHYTVTTNGDVLKLSNQVDGSVAAERETLSVREVPVATIGACRTVTARRQVCTALYVVGYTTPHLVEVYVAVIGKVHSVEVEVGKLSLRSHHRCDRYEAH